MLRLSELVNQLLRLTLPNFKVIEKRLFKVLPKRAQNNLYFGSFTRISFVKIKLRCEVRPRKPRRQNPDQAVYQVRAARTRLTNEADVSCGENCQRIKATKVIYLKP